MRNLFDQYSEPENRLTHALACSLDRDRGLLDDFFRWVLGRRIPRSRRIHVLEQRLPGQAMADFAEPDERRGLPDLWFHDEEETWCLLGECKIAARLTTDQLRRHERSARRQGFEAVELFTLTTDARRQRSLAGVAHRSWSELYDWLHRRHLGSAWARELIDFMEIAEDRMTAEGYLREGSLTTFTGIPFDRDHPYSYGEAKRVLRLAMDELRQRRDLRRLGADADSGGRPAITGRHGSVVWDLIPLAGAHGAQSFTKHPHFTLGVHEEQISAMVTLPNAAAARYRRNLLELDDDEVFALVAEVCRRMKQVLRPVPAAKPILYVLQRHFRSQRSAGIVDGDARFDLRTAIPGKEGGVKYQPEWLTSAFALIRKRRGANLQVGIGASIPQGSPQMKTRASLDVIAGCWAACEPWLERLRA